jgi:hypothetical protein
MATIRSTRRASIAVRILSVAVVVAGLLLGIWLAGGVITNDFGAAMALTIAWMGIAGLACLAVEIGRASCRERV